VGRSRARSVLEQRLDEMKVCIPHSRSIAETRPATLPPHRLTSSGGMASLRLDLAAGLRPQIAKVYACAPWGRERDAEKRSALSALSPRWLELRLRFSTRARPALGLALGDTFFRP